MYFSVRFVSGATRSQTKSWFANGFANGTMYFSADSKEDALAWCKRRRGIEFHLNSLKKISAKEYNDTYNE